MGKIEKKNTFTQKKFVSQIPYIVPGSASKFLDNTC